MTERIGGGRGGRLVRRRMRFENQFTQMPNSWVRDERLTYQSRGILLVLMSHEVGYSITMHALVNDAPNGREAVNNAVRELEGFGYLTRIQRRDSQGRMTHVDWELSDPHQPENTRSEPLYGKPSDGKPDNGFLTPETRMTKEDQLRTLKESSRDNHTSALARETCPQGHDIIDVSGGGVPFCAFGCTATPALVTS